MAVKGQEMMAHLLLLLGTCPKSFSLEQTLVLAIGVCDRTLSIVTAAVVMWLSRCGTADGVGRIDRHSVTIVSTRIDVSY